MQSRNILIVDDDESLRETWRDILEDEGYQIASAGSRAEGIAKAMETCPEAALLDERLPDGSGTLLLAELRKINPDCLCIMMTAYAELETIMTAIERGVFHYLVKPVSPPELIHVLNKAFETIRLREDKSQAEQALKESERRFREILENVRISSVCLDLEGKITFINDFMLEMTGWTYDEVIGRDWFEVFLPPSRSLKSREAYTRKIKSNTVPAYGQSTIITRDGAVRHLSWNNTFLQDPNETIIGMASLGEDITDSRQAVKALRASEDRMKGILERIQAGIVLVDEQTAQVVDANPSALQTVGLARDQVIGVECGKVFKGLYSERSLNHGDRIEQTEREITRSDGKTVPVLCTLVPTLLGGKPHVVCSFIDLTDRKALEEEQSKAEKLESVGLLAGGIAHDFNNLLTGILGNITLARMYVTAGETAHKRLAEAEKACLRAKDLTQQLLTFASGGAPLKKTSSIEDLLRDAASFAARGSGCRCEFDLPDDLWLAPVDEGQIVQVINNLVINAVQAMPRGGTVHIRARNVERGGEDVLAPIPVRPYVKVSIADTGPGIPKHHLRTIFDPYFTTKQKGSGLGLTTAYSVVRRHEGAITVESQEGVGAVFHVYLPAADGTTAAPIAERREPVAGKGKVLVMDDEEIIRDLMADLLLSLGYEAVFAAEGVETLELYREALEAGRPFDAVVIDLTIPGGMGGRGAIDALRKIDPNVKAIVSSGYSNDPIMSDFLNYGFVDVMAKPYGVQELSEVLYRVIKRKRP